MEGLKVSLVTISYNAALTIQKCIDSVLSQTYSPVEYIVIDGNSVDGTQNIIIKNKLCIQYFTSEPDKGIYVAMNKGLKLATGDVVGLLNADDYFANEHVLSDIVSAFMENDPDVLYADLDYVNHSGAVIRKWRSGLFLRKKFNWGWMPPHPTFYVKRILFNEMGFYNLDFGTAADYELMLRFLYQNQLKVFYLNKVIVKMKSGGISNRSFGNRLRAWKWDLKAMLSHGVRLPLLAITLKPVRKIFQLFHNVW